MWDDIFIIFCNAGITIMIKRPDTTSLRCCCLDKYYQKQQLQTMTHIYYICWGGHLKIKVVGWGSGREWEKEEDDEEKEKKKGREGRGGGCDYCHDSILNNHNKKKSNLYLHINSYCNLHLFFSCILFIYLERVKPTIFV